MVITARLPNKQAVQLNFRGAGNVPLADVLVVLKNSREWAASNLQDVQLLLHTKPAPASVPDGTELEVVIPPGRSGSRSRSRSRSISRSSGSGPTDNDAWMRDMFYTLQGPDDDRDTVYFTEGTCITRIKDSSKPDGFRYFMDDE